MNEQPKNVWDYKVLDRFKDKYFKNILREQDIENELFVAPKNTETNKKLEQQVYTIFSGAVPPYIIPKMMEDKTDGELKDIKSMLPIKVRGTSSVAIREKVYSLITNYGKFRIEGQPILNFRDFIDQTVAINHTNQINQLILAFVVAGGVFDKLCVRVSTEPGFGKNSIVYLYQNLGEAAELLEPRTIAKLFLRLETNLLCMEEVATVPEQYRYDIESIIGAVGDKRPEYDRPTRNLMIPGKEKYYIQPLSLLLIYNNLENNRSLDSYFDKIFIDKTLDRAFPLKLTGKMNHRFERINNIDAEFEMYEKDMLEWTKSRVFYHSVFKSDITPYLKGYRRRYPQVSNNSSFCRWDDAMDTICTVAEMYCNSEEEFHMFEEAIVNRHHDYLKMVSEGDVTPKVQAKPINTLKEINTVAIDDKQSSFDASNY